MGLEEFQTKSQNDYKKYSNPKQDEKLEAWVEELEERFPIDLKIEFVEASPAMTKCRGTAYRKSTGKYYIRISKSFMRNHSDRRVKLTLLHEMVHVYFYRQGYNDTAHDKYFRWVVGRVGASMTNMWTSNQKWQDCIEPFLEEENK